MSSNSDRDRRLAERFLEAEKLMKKSLPPKEKRKWLKVNCLYCQKKIEYFPKEGWDGQIRCPHCGKIFKVTRLDDFKPS